MNKPSSRGARPLAELLGATLSDAFRQQGFASAELVTRWTEIVGADIAAHAEPMKIQWPRAVRDEPPAPGTLVLRVEGPAALEIQHLAGPILERVNRFFGWQAVNRLALRQAPLSRRGKKPAAKALNPEAVAQIAEGLPQDTDEELREALARLGAAVKCGR
jgi:hypothetical protein